MFREFDEEAGWYAILDYLYAELFPPTFLELLEDYRCQFSRRDRRGIVSKKTVRPVIDCLEELGRETDTASLAQWLQHTGTTVAIVVLEAIQGQLPKADSLEGVEPEPLTGCEAVLFCLCRLLERP